MHIYTLRGRIQNKVVKNKIEERLNERDGSGSCRNVIRGRGRGGLRNWAQVRIVMASAFKGSMR